MQPQSFSQLSSDSEHRVQGGHRFLKDHPDLVAANRAHQLLIGCGKVDILAFLAIKDERSARNFTAAKLDQTHQRKAGNGLSRAGFPNNTNSFTRVHFERNIFDTYDGAALCFELDPQVFDGRNCVIQHAADTPLPMLIALARR